MVLLVVFHLEVGFEESVESYVLVPRLLVLTYAFSLSLSLRKKSVSDLSVKHSVAVDLELADKR